MYSLPYEDIDALYGKYNGLIKRMNAQCELGEMSNKQFKEGFTNCIRQFRKDFMSIAMKAKWGDQGRKIDGRNPENQLIDAGKC